MKRLLALILALLLCVVSASCGQTVQEEKDPADTGIPSAFDAEKADFTRMGTGAAGAPLYIGKVLQNVKVIVDEEGTEAAAATAIMMAEGAAFEEEPPIELSFDESFVYLITDTSYNIPLFMGVVTDPS